MKQLSFILLLFHCMRMSASEVPWRYPDGQQYLYSDKELTRADGRLAYTFPARTMLPSLPRWTTPDPLAEQTPWDSP